jgi:predicted RNase H-like HicB family nuclease
MLTYRVAYYIQDDGVTAKALDFPAVISSGSDLVEARRMVQSALAEVTQFYVETGRIIPAPDPSIHDPQANLIEPLALDFAVSSASQAIEAKVGA